MNNWRRSFLSFVTLVGLLVLTGDLFGLRSQETGSKSEPVDPKVTTRLTLGSASGEPGTAVVVPIYFTPAEQSAIGSTTVTINFVSKNLKFSKVDLAAAAEQGNVEIKTATEMGKNDQGLETTTLTVDASVPAGSGKAIPSGLLGYITFSVSQTAVPATISLRAEARGKSAGDGSPAKDIRAFGAQVEVLAEGEGGMVACFFFTH